MNANNEELDDILEWDPDTLQWVVLGRMTQPRYQHAMSVVSEAEKLCKMETFLIFLNGK